MKPYKYGIERKINMSVKTRTLKYGKCEITQEYKGTSHRGIDLVREGYQLDEITAHSDGTVVQVINNCNANTPNDPTNPGNMVKIDHGNGYQTRYLHLAYKTVKVNVGDRVKKGEVIGYMGNTGNSFGGHLHFEVMKNGTQIDPTKYLNANLPENSQTDNEQVNVYYKVKTKKHGWLPEVKNLDDYAGYEDSPITDLAIKVDKGEIKYRVHVKGGEWLPYITGYDINNSRSGYAGNGKIIDAIEAYYYTPSNIRPYKKAKYKVNNYPYQYDNEKDNGQDGYAGKFGTNITKFQITIE